MGIATAPRASAPRLDLQRLTRDAMTLESIQMTQHLFAVCISRTVRERLKSRPFQGRVLAAFDDVCDVATPDGDVIAVVQERIGNGPLNIVIGIRTGGFAGFQPGTRAALRAGLIEIGAHRVSWQDAVVWEPRPDWEALRATGGTLAPRVASAARACNGCAPPGSLLEIFGAGGDAGAATVRRAALTAAAGAVTALRAGWHGDADALQAGAAGLAGLGGGLTPAGDDFLCGAMLCAWLTHPFPETLCRRVVEVAAPRTTVLSAALLRAAARGECTAAWHRILRAVCLGMAAEVASAVHEVMSHGATSGADALAGFLWAAAPA